MKFQGCDCVRVENCRVGLDGMERMGWNGWNGIERDGIIWNGMGWNGMEQMRLDVF